MHPPRSTVARLCRVWGVGLMVQGLVFTVCLENPAWSSRGAFSPLMTVFAPQPSLSSGLRGIVIELQVGSN